MRNYVETLFEFSKSLLEVADIEELLPVIQDLVIKEANAERCKIVLYDDNGEILFARARQKGSKKDATVDTPISSKVVAKAWESKEVIVSSNAMEDAQFGEQKIDGSIMMQKLLSVACAPLKYGQKTFGVIYIDNRQKEAVFTERTGQLLKGLGDLMSEALMKSLENTLKQRQESERQQLQILELRSEVDRLKGYDEIIGNSPSMKKVYELIEKVKDYKVNVLITGESGTGKELVARALHRKSKRNDKQFIKVDCSTIPESVVESALFGHEKGAFTGADKTKIGFFEEADGGTLFIDEIANINLNIQRKLLQFIDRKVYYRVGSTEERTSDARLVFATNKNILDLIAEGKFMEDLYFRITEGVEHVLPPLKQRGEDILLIAEDILRKKAVESEKPIKAFSKEAKECLLRYSYPGNVRELRQIVIRALLNAQTDKIQFEDLPAKLVEGKSEFYLGPRSHSLSLAGIQSTDTYKKYLPDEHQERRFIYGLKSEDISNEPSEREFHEKVVILVSDASNVPLKEAVRAVGAAFELNYIIQKLIQTNGRISKACELSRIDKKTLIEKMKSHSLKREWFVK